MIYGFISVLSEIEWVGKVILIIPLISGRSSIFMKVVVFLFMKSKGGGVFGKRSDI